MHRKYIYIIGIILLQSNASALDTLFVTNDNQYHPLQEHLLHYTDSTNDLTFKAVQTKQFKQRVFSEFLPIQHTYWSVFQLENDTTAEFELQYPKVDSITFYFPKKDGTYQQITRGAYTKEEKARPMPLVYFSFSAKTYDLSKPIYFRVRNFSKWGADYNFEQHVAVKRMLEQRTIIKTEELDTLAFLTIIFLGISGFLCIYFFIQYIVNKKPIFLLYAAYLLTLFIYYFNRSSPTFFWTLFDEPKIMVLINENTQMISSVIYLFFVIKFINIKVNYPKLYRLLMANIILISLLILTFSITFYFFPFNPFHLIIMPIFRLMTLLTSIISTIVILRYRPNTLEWIAVTSGITLVLAAILPVILGHLSLSLPFIIMEIMLLAVGLAYQIRLNDLERLSIKEELINQLKINTTIQEKMQRKLEQEVKTQTEKAILKTQEAEQAKAAQLQSIFEQKMEYTRMKALQAQMNPHFIFNCLNSIRLFYLKNEIQKADDYITKFSRLLRMILNNSRSNFISLKQELDTLQLYVEFEQMRFKNKFDFDLHIDTNIDTGVIKIHPMAIQPFVENAIWHGLMPLKIRGKLSIKIQQFTDRINIYIEDNGIGRAAAKESTNSHNQIHQSHGLMITQERLELLQKILKKEASFEIIDLINNDKPTGTKVTITYIQ